MYLRAIYILDIDLFLQMSANQGISAFPEGDDIFKWVGTLEGASGTVSILPSQVFIVLTLSVHSPTKPNKRK